VEWFRLVAVHARLGAERFLGLAGSGPVVHVVRRGVDVYGFGGGVDVGAVEAVLGGLARFKRVSLCLDRVYLLRFAALSIELRPLAVPSGCAVLYIVGRVGGRYRLGVGVAGCGEDVALGLARALGAVGVEAVGVEEALEGVGAWPEAEPPTVVEVLRPLETPALRTPLTTYLARLGGGGGLFVGWLLDHMLRRVGRAELPRDPGHVLVVGATGSGKSTTLRRLCTELARAGKRVVVLDWVGEHAEAMRGRARIVRPGIDASIPLRERGESVEMFVDRLAYYIETAWGRELTPLQRRILATAASRIDEPSVERLLAAVSRWLASDRRDYAQSADALISRLSVLRALSRVFDPGTPPLRLPERGVLVLDLSSVEPPWLRKLVAHAALYHVLREARERGGAAVAVDEAHNLLDTDARNAVVEAFLEYRKFGVGMLLATSDFTEIPRQLLQNASTVIAHRIPSLRQAEALADTLCTTRSERDDWVHTLRTLPTGIAAIVNRASPYPALVEIEP